MGSTALTLVTKVHTKFMRYKKGEKNKSSICVMPYKFIKCHLELTIASIASNLYLCQSMALTSSNLILKHFTLSGVSLPIISGPALVNNPEIQYWVLDHHTLSYSFSGSPEAVTSHQLATLNMLLKIIFTTNYWDQSHSLANYKILKQIMQNKNR